MWYQNEGNQKYVEDNYISKIGCPQMPTFGSNFATLDSETYSLLTKYFSNHSR